MKNPKTLLFSLFALLGFLNPVFAQNIYQKIDSSLKDFQKTKNFNGVVLIAENDAVAFYKAYGYKDFDKKLPLRKNDKFYFASITKTFVGVSIAKLIEEGKIALDDKMVKYLPELDEKIYGRITIYQMLHHTSGLPNDYQELLDKLPKTVKTFGNDDLIELYRKDKVPLDFEPGTEHAYSNVGFVFLASIIERVAGKSFEEFIRQNLLPRKSKTDLFVLRSGADVSRIVPAFYRDQESGRWKAFEFGFYRHILETTYGDGGVCGDAESLFKWGQMLQKGEIIKRSSLEKVWSAGKLNDESTFPYGFGWRVSPEKRFYYHGGGNMGFYNLFGLYPDKKKTIIILSNSDMKNDIAAVYKAVEKMVVGEK